MLEAFLEPVEAYEDEDGVDEDGGSQHGNPVQDDLLIGMEQVEVDGVETALGGRAGGEEKGIDVGQLRPGVNDDGGEKNHGDDVGVVEKDEIDMDVFEKRNAGFDFGQPVDGGGGPPQYGGIHDGEHREPVSDTTVGRRRRRSPRREAKGRESENLGAHVRQEDEAAGPCRSVAESRLAVSRRQAGSGQAENGH